MMIRPVAPALSARGSSVADPVDARARPAQQPLHPVLARLDGMLGQRSCTMIHCATIKCRCSTSGRGVNGRADGSQHVVTHRAMVCCPASEAESRHDL